MANLVLIGQKYYPGLNILIFGSDIPDLASGLAGSIGSVQPGQIQTVTGSDINTILSLMEGPSVAGGIGDSKNGPRSDIIEL